MAKLKLVKAPEEPEDKKPEESKEPEEPPEDTRPVRYEVSIKAPKTVGSGRGRLVPFWNRRNEYKKQRWMRLRRAREEKAAFRGEPVRKN